MVKFGIFMRRADTDTLWSYQYTDYSKVCICNACSAKRVVSESEPGTDKDEAREAPRCRTEGNMSLHNLEIMSSNLVPEAPQSPHPSSGPLKRMDHLTLFLQNNFACKTLKPYFITMSLWFAINFIKLLTIFFSNSRNIEEYKIKSEFLSTTQFYF